jgi:hypothetical protein
MGSGGASLAGPLAAPAADSHAFVLDLLQQLAGFGCKVISRCR